MNLSSKYGISPGHSIHKPIAIDGDPQAGLNIQVGGLSSPPAETRAPSKRLEPSIIQLNDPTTGSEGLSEDVHVFTPTQEEPSASALSTPVELVSNDDMCLDTQVESVASTKSNAPFGMSLYADVSIFGWGSDLSDLSDSEDKNESEWGPSSSNSQEVGPRSLKLATVSDF